MTNFWILAGSYRAHSAILIYATVKKKYSSDAEVDFKLGFPTTLLPGKQPTQQPLVSCASNMDKENK